MQYTVRGKLTRLWDYQVWRAGPWHNLLQQESPNSVSGGASHCQHPADGESGWAACRWGVYRAIIPLSSRSLQKMTHPKGSKCLELTGLRLPDSSLKARRLQYWVRGDLSLSLSIIFLEMLCWWAMINRVQTDLWSTYVASYISVQVKRSINLIPNRTTRQLMIGNPFPCLN